VNNDEKILNKLEALEAGQKVLQSDVTAMKGEVEKIPILEKQLAQVSNEVSKIPAIEKQLVQMRGDVSKIPAMEKQLDQHGKLLTGIAANMGTVLEEQQAQRMDIRSLHTDMGSLHTELHAVKDELKAEILSARTEAKADSIDLKATVIRQLKDHEKRIDALEEDAGIPHPDKN
jgi:hypothetical protein